ncbi:MAG: reprolysin-like metallopeptidase, partial [Chitinophagales bacterium]
MKRLLLCIALITTTIFSFSQQNYWAAKNYAEIDVKGTQYIFPTKHETYQLNYDALKDYLWNAPLHDFEGNLQLSSIEIALPMPDGSFENFKIVESPVYEEGFTTVFPGIKTFLAYSLEHPEWYTRLDITPHGFHAMIMGTENGSIFIDPISHGGVDVEHYLVYYKRDFLRTNEAIQCQVEEIAADNSLDNDEFIIKSFGTCELRTYRLALSATGEYTAFQGGTVADAAAAQVTTMNRVNGVFERDMAIHMNIIANNNLIIYDDAATDPFTNGTTNAMINENQTNTDNVIGNANYDIGHVFGTNSGGLAGLGVVCWNSQKGRGVTGSAAPTGDPFDIDYVAHEMGHQFNANHTQNNNCNRNGATAMEPGSASTIMGYAGICA